MHVASLTIQFDQKCSRVFCSDWIVAFPIKMDQIDERTLKCYTSIPGYFLQDDIDTVASTFDFVRHISLDWDINQAWHAEDDRQFWPQEQRRRAPRRPSAWNDAMAKVWARNYPSEQWSAIKHKVQTAVSWSSWPRCTQYSERALWDAGLGCMLARHTRHINIDLCWQCLKFRITGQSWTETTQWGGRMPIWRPLVASKHRKQMTFGRNRSPSRRSPLHRNTMWVLLIDAARRPTSPSQGWNYLRTVCSVQ